MKGKIDKDSKWKDVKFYKNVGCEQCNNNGYRGRIGIFEVLAVDAEMEKLISQKASTDEMEAKSKRDGLLTMLEDGFVKAVQGITTLEEVMRVTKE